MIKNLSQLKKQLIAGAEFDIVGHCRPECIGQRRKINVANTTGVYTIVPGEPDSKATLANKEKGSFLGWSKAPFWEFRADGVCALYSSDKERTPEHLIIAIRTQ